MKAPDWINDGAERRERERSGSKTAEWQIVEGNADSRRLPAGQAQRSQPGRVGRDSGPKEALILDGEVIQGT